MSESRSLFFFFFLIKEHTTPTKNKKDLIVSFCSWLFLSFLIDKKKSIRKSTQSICCTASWAKIFWIEESNFGYCRTFRLRLNFWWAPFCCCQIIIWYLPTACTKLRSVCLNIFQDKIFPYIPVNILILREHSKYFKILIPKRKVHACLSQV